MSNATIATKLSKEAKNVFLQVIEQASRERIFVLQNVLSIMLILGNFIFLNALNVEKKLEKQIGNLTVQREKTKIEFFVLVLVQQYITMHTKLPGQEYPNLKYSCKANFRSFIRPLIFISIEKTLLIQNLTFISLH